MPEDSKKSVVAGYDGTLEDLARTISTLAPTDLADFAGCFRNELARKSKEARATKDVRHLAIPYEKAATSMTSVVIELKQVKNLATAGKKP